MLNVVILPDDRLHRRSQPVRNVDEELISYCMQMIETMHAHKGVGLAGVQTGRMEDVFVVHVPDDEPRIFINPEITAYSDTTCTSEEGCLSIPGIYADVERPDGVHLRFLTADGSERSFHADGYLARVIQHEYDHLQGRLFYSYLKPGQQKRFLKRYTQGRQEMQ